MAFGGEDAESYFDDGLTAAKKGDFERAVVCFSRAIHLDKAYAAAYHQLGQCLVRLGDLERGAPYLFEAVKRRPANVPARIDLGFALLASGRTDRALEQFQEVLIQDMQNWRAHLGLASVAFEKGNYQSAVDEALAAQALGGSGVALLYLLGRASQLTGNGTFGAEVLSRADKLLEASMEAQTTQPEASFMRGEIAMARGQFSQALERYHAAETMVQSGRVYSAFGVAFTALDTLARQGVCYQRLSRTDQAREMGKRILAVDPTHKLGKTLVEG